MNKEYVLNSIALKKRFCKDCGIPITVFDNPYFEERMQILDELHECVTAFDTFVKALTPFNNEQEYFEYYNSVKDAMINSIKTHPDFGAFIDKEITCDTAKYPRRNLYVEENDKGFFASIDMKKANFSALHHWFPAIFQNCDTWEEFVDLFTSNQHIKNSKYIRQVVLGACNPKRQIKYEYMLMIELMDAIKAAIPHVNIVSVQNDEIILNLAECGYSRSQLLHIIDKTPFSNMVRLNIFELEKIKSTDGWMKTIYGFGEDEKYEFKCLNAEIYHQIVKHFNSETISENDLVFYHNGQLAKYLKEVDNPWKE